MELVYTYPSKAAVLIKKTLKALSSSLSDLNNYIAKAQQNRVDYWRLNNMSDKDLKDIGVTRGDLKERFYKG